MRHSWQKRGESAEAAQSQAHRTLHVKAPDLRCLTGQDHPRCWTRSKVTHRDFVAERLQGSPGSQSKPQLPAQEPRRREAQTSCSGAVAWKARPSCYGGWRPACQLYNEPNSHQVPNIMGECELASEVPIVLDLTEARRYSRPSFRSTRQLPPSVTDWEGGEEAGISPCYGVWGRSHFERRRSLRSTFNLQEVM